ncbi:anti-sigma factor [Ochrobactrum sp. RH2CCR150]|uniref:anti-sigma factor family protein n=1 Tax=Ochrobactrum sp. RH2CCR150 TaxID=2587044 RepID=UPI0015FE48F4|nr:anti-sigma factor RsiW [Ochrobactrum sp. RH2CCR150]
MKNRLISDAELQAYVDGLLPVERRQVIEAELSANPQLASEIGVWQRQNETLQALYSHVAQEPVPARLNPGAIRDEIRSTRQGSWRMAAAAVVLVAVGAGAGWFGRDALEATPPSSMPLVSEAMAAHSLYTSEIVHPVEVKAEQEQHLSAWLSKRLERTLVIPDLRTEGLSLVGGRLLPANGGPAAQLMYEDTSGKRVTLFIVPSDDNKETSLRYLTRGNLEALIWSDNALNCALVGDLPRPRLQQIAMSAYKQFE